MKRIFLSFGILLLIGQFNVDGLSPFPIHNANAPIQIDASLSVRAKIYLDDEDEENDPVETNFYLLDESMVKILQAAKCKPIFTDGKKHKVSDEDYLEAAVKSLAF